AVPTWGTPPYTVSWVLGDGTRASSPNLTHVFASPGPYSNEVWVNDSDHQSVGGWQNVTVSPALRFDLNQSAPVVEAGEPFFLTANSTGGTGPVQFDWLFGDGTYGNGTNVSHVYAVPGNYTPRLWVNDSAGVSVEKTLNVSVSGSKSASSTASTQYGYYAAIGVVLVVVAIAALLLVRKGRGPSSPPAENVEPDTAATPLSEETESAVEAAAEE
ncbi:MAG: PKD domain-containing protein, partial [Thermoplasmata archaeon]|nr:PKD domain-containing protein [Thermoplasmata archaeon]